MKLRLCSPNGWHGEKRASNQPGISQKIRKIICTKLSRESLVVEFSSNELLRSEAKFLVDTGTDINVIKLNTSNEDLLVDENRAIEITGIIQSRISTTGTLNFELMKSKITFHVVHSDFPISTDGILGREYSLTRKSRNILLAQHDCHKFPPYQTYTVTDNGSRVALENITEYKEPMLGLIQVRARTRRDIPTAVINSKKRKGTYP